MIVPSQARLHRMLVGSVAVVCAGVFMLASSIVRAEDGNPAPGIRGSIAESAAALETPLAATDEIHRWIKELDSDLFANREGSAQRLFESGRPAIEPLAEAARGVSFEQTTAAISILRRLMRSGDSDTKNAAKTALEQIAQGHCDSASSLAADALAPPVTVPSELYPPRTRPMIRNMNARLMRVAPAPIIAVVAGQRTIANDNGKTIRIDEDPQNGIVLRVTEIVNGVATMNSYQAKDADDLKQRFPEAHKLYERAKGMKEARVMQTTRAIAVGGGAVVAPAQGNPFGK